MRSKSGIFTATCILKIKNNTTFTCCLNGAKALVIDCEVSRQNATSFLLEGNSMHCPVYIQ